jgi:hypothetical protein
MAERLCWEFGRVFRFLSFSITYQVNTPSELSMQVPLLPVELEKEIFQMAAYSRPLSIPRLMLVAHRVKIWFVHSAKSAHMRRLT